MLPTFYGFVSTNKHGRPIWQFKLDGMVYFIPADRWNGEILPLEEGLRRRRVQ